MSIRTFNSFTPGLGKAVYIDDSAVVIGQVSLGDDVSIWPTTVIRGDVASVSIGEGTNVQDGSVLHGTHAGKYTDKGFPLTIGKGVTIGHKVIAHGCTVGDYCLIGMGAIIMDGAELEDYVILGAGSLVAHFKKLESGFLYLGSPAKKIRPLSAAEKEFLQYSYVHYIELKNQYLSQLA